MVRLAFFLFLLGGCATLTGLDELTTDLPSDPSGPGTNDEAGAVSSGGPSTNPNTNPDSSTVPSDGGTTPPISDGSSLIDGAPAPTRIRNITFEDGALVHATSGFDSIFGTAQVQSQSPIAGAHSMLVDGAAQWGTVSFAPATDFYLTLYFRIDSAPSSVVGETRFLRITHAGGAPIEAFVRSSPRELVVVQGVASLGTFGNAPLDGEICRLEIRTRSTGSMTTRLVRNGSSTSLGGSGTFGAVSKVEVGSLAGGTLRATFDDLGLDTAVQP